MCSDETRFSTEELRRAGDFTVICCSIFFLFFRVGVKKKKLNPGAQLPMFITWNNYLFRGSVREVSVVVRRERSDLEEVWGGRGIGTQEKDSIAGYTYVLGAEAFEGCDLLVRERERENRVMLSFILFSEIIALGEATLERVSGSQTWVAGHQGIPVRQNEPASDLVPWQLNLIPRRTWSRSGTWLAHYSVIVVHQVHFWWRLLQDVFMIMKSNGGKIYENYM